MKKYISKIKYLLIFITLFITITCISCATNDTNGPQNGIAPTPRNLYFENTSKGIYLRWTDVSDGLYNVRYEVKMVFDDGKIVTEYCDLPVYEFSDYLRDQSLTITFTVSTCPFNQLGGEIYEYQSLKSEEIVYEYSSPDSYQTAPIVTNLSLNEDTWELNWQGNNDSTKYIVKIIREYDNGTITSREINVTVKVNEEGLYRTSLASYYVDNVTKYEIQVKACGIKDGSQGTVYYHSSSWSEKLIKENN